MPTAQTPSSCGMGLGGGLQKLLEGSLASHPHPYPAHPHRAGVPGGWVDDRWARPPNPRLAVGRSLPGALPPGGLLGALRLASREHAEGSSEAGPGAQSSRGFGSFSPSGLGPRKRWLVGDPGHITCPSTSVSRHGCQSLPPGHEQRPPGQARNPAALLLRDLSAPAHPPASPGGPEGTGPHAKGEDAVGPSHPSP